MMPAHAPEADAIRHRIGNHPRNNPGDPSSAFCKETEHGSYDFHDSENQNAVAERASEDRVCHIQRRQFLKKAQNL